MFSKVIVQGVSAILLMGAVTMFVAGAQAGALRPKPTESAPIVAAVDVNLQSASIDLF